MENWHLPTFFSFLLYRLTSVLFIQTSYAPDEYWQSLEVAHKMAFGYGYLTWEWKHGLRSYIHPSIFYIFYKFLSYFSLDHPLLIVTLPKVFQAVVTAISDQYFLMLCLNFGFQKYWIKIAIFTNWFWYYCGMRTIVNTFETCLTIIALYYYPWQMFVKSVKENRKTHDMMWKNIKKKSLVYLTLACVNCLIRPTAATIWAPLVLFQWFSLSSQLFKKFFWTCLIPACLITLPPSLLIDYTWYGKLTFPALNFLIFNIFKGVSSHYGTHSIHWYLSQGLPVVLGLQYIPILMGLIFFMFNESDKAKNQFRPAFIVLVFVILLNIIILSNIPHKEFRFLLPIMPLMMLLAIKFESEFFIRRQKLKFFWTLVLTASFVVPSTLFGVLHQKGGLQLIHYLRSEIGQSERSPSFLFLMPCHSTPLYSHLHVNVSTRFLECEPPLTEDIVDESDVFFADPNKWLNIYWEDTRNEHPTHIAFFDSLESSIEPFLKSKGYVKKRQILHTVLARPYTGRYIFVYEIGGNKNALKKDDPSDKEH